MQAGVEAHQSQGIEMGPGVSLLPGWQLGMLKGQLMLAPKALSYGAVLWGWLSARSSFPAVVWGV